jgi:hypothetical protein
VVGQAAGRVVEAYQRSLERLPSKAERPSATPENATADIAE